MEGDRKAFEELLIIHFKAIFFANTKKRLAETFKSQVINTQQYSVLLK